MSGIEKIQRYIDRTDGKFPTGTPYQMSINELFTLGHMASEDATRAICLAFDYGRAKGYRAATAKKEGADMKGKIMTVGDLEDITDRLAGCQALLYVLCESAGTSSISENAVRGVSDLLDSICRDRQADINGAEDYAESGL